ncbi:hypothetical protein HMPREF9431_01941 [Segatella oulorum F0390]|uniref:Uncharacterized protein n=2 Tax=Segatella oulorum TaxID=28136 RepID=G1WDP0_9BACT|nr:hypothetical protein HMPREF9431_01941 [Segatella oulorum F0390]
MSLGRIVCGCITEIGRGGACVPARVALQGRIHRHPPHTMRVFLGMETPLRERSGGHIGTAPTASFGWIAHGTVDFVWMDCVQMVILFVWKNMMEIGRGGAYVPARVAPQGRIHR